MIQVTWETLWIDYSSCTGLLWNNNMVKSGNLFKAAQSLGGFSLDPLVVFCYKENRYLGASVLVAFVILLAIE